MKYHVDLHFARQHRLPVERITVEAATKAEARLEAEKVARAEGFPVVKKAEVYQAREEAA